jgi:hypothetical protein
LAPAADAAASKYPPAAAARGFSGGSTGADGGGFRSTYTGAVGATAVGGTSSGVWESPVFTYTGTAGGEATGISLALDRRASVDQLLAVAGNSAEYTVRLIDLSEAGEALTLIASTTLAGAHSWTGVSRGPIDPESLTRGDEYRLQITSSYTTGTSVLVSGSADYDNVVLEASDGTSGKGKGKGNGGNGGGALSEQRLEDLLRQATPGTAVLKGNGKRLFVRVKCPHKIGHACRTTAQGLLRQHHPATGKRTVRLRSGKSRLVVLRVKPKARKRVAKRKRLLVRQRVRAGKVTATVIESRRLIRR